ncbi:futalosine hydrolase [Bacillus shivajii]|uniref:futalosine hydrolase n=1 Tax=Bacillus shivajii TaxID=1983719 RepID=UPI001CF95801|nr:futalosine hydrolase [Bacillus shivajii]UCZ53603.1 futalosine hydrolase [Bacillus shivajii]
MNTNMEKILIVTSVDAEKEAIERGLVDVSKFDVHVIGVGPMNAAAATAVQLTKQKYDLVINMGIGGGFPEVAEVGSIVVSTEQVAADLGAESPNGFKPIEELGFGESRMINDSQLVATIVTKLKKADLSTYQGPILTLATVTGTRETTQVLAERIPGAAVEAMEGFGVATAAKQQGIPTVEIRAISNPVGPRDRGAWKIKEALQALEKASVALKEVF